jgi:hypothetical protein
MEYPKKLEKNATYKCGHTLHLTKTVHNDDQEEYFLCCDYGYGLCPECSTRNRMLYSHVYDALKDTRYDWYQILFKRNDVIRGNYLWEESVCNSPDCLASTIFLVENDINHHCHEPVGLYKGDHFVPFDGYTADYMRWLLKHNKEAVQKELELQDLRDAKRKEMWGL